MESDQVKPQTGCPRPGVLCRGDKPPWLAGGLDSTHEEGMHWLSLRQGRKKSALSPLGFQQPASHVPQPKVPSNTPILSISRHGTAIGSGKP